MTCLFRIMLFTIVAFFFLFQQPSFAESDYVLSYPSLMPGHPLYKVSEIVDWMQGVWSFGSFAKFKYHLTQSDKKLVEAKTLFEYKQYLLAVSAVSSYEKHLRLSHNFLKKSQREGKNASEKKKIFKNAIAKHRQILEKIRSEHPSRFIWKSEKEKQQTIEIHMIIDRIVGYGTEYEKD